MPGPRVLFDTTAVPSDRGGVGRYTDALLRALADRHQDPVVVCQARDVETVAALGVREIITAPAATASRAKRLVWEQTGLPSLVARIGADVLHSPHYTAPARPGAASVVTLHDATFFTDPGVHLAVKAATFRSATRIAVRRAARCVVPSTATRDEVVRLTGADPERLHVAPHGVDTGLFAPVSAQGRAEFAHRMGLGRRPWIAFLATMEPRKNVGGLVRGWVRAFAGLAATAPSEVPALVLAGGPGWDGALPSVLSAVPPGMPLLTPGYLPLKDLPALLGGAEVVAYPSLGEGFGLPVLEGMACGAAVLTTRLLSLPEVGGDAVAYCEPDPASIAAALGRLHTDRDLRERLGRAARSRALGFSWEASAEIHVRAWSMAAAEQDR